MIKVIIFKQKECIKGIEVSGHAGYANSGEDIVCAGVSALTISLINSLKHILKIKVICKIKSGYTKCIIPEDIEPNKLAETELLFKSYILGYKNIRDSYKSYIEVIEEEV